MLHFEVEEVSDNKWSNFSMFYKLDDVPFLSLINYGCKLSLFHLEMRDTDASQLDKNVGKIKVRLPENKNVVYRYKRRAGFVITIACILPRIDI